tara:strand:+ start:53188 stop:54051 length:864 start_codon:yes stop_codon:yes gene_type:complete
VAIIALSSLPYFHEILTTKSAGIKDWVPSLGIESFLTGEDGKVLGFSTYRMFLYQFCIFLFATIGWGIWWFVAKQKRYRNFLLLPIFIGIYQLTLMLLKLRDSFMNRWELKLCIILGVFLILVLSTLRKYRFNSSKVLLWLLFIGFSILPFFHDIITDRGTGLKPWVPVLGIEEFMTFQNGKIAGFGTYRAFLYFLQIHLFAHLGWLGAFIYYAHHIRKPRFFLLVPVVISLFSVVVIVLDWSEEGFNTPDVKFYTTVALGLLIALNFYFNNKRTYVKQLINENKSA